VIGEAGRVVDDGEDGIAAARSDLLVDGPVDEERGGTGDDYERPYFGRLRDLRHPSWSGSPR
jgi:hypothetical protein